MRFLVITSAVVIGLAMPATAQQSDSTHRSGNTAKNTAPFGAYGYGGAGSLISACQPQCGVANGNTGFIPPAARKCVFKCIAAKRAAPALSPTRATEAEAMQAKVLTDDEARRIAANIAKLPALVKRED